MSDVVIQRVPDEDAESSLAEAFGGILLQASRVP